MRNRIEASRGVVDRMDFYVPPTLTLLAGIARVALRHAQLDHSYKMTLKTLGGESLCAALEKTTFLPSGALRETIDKLAGEELGHDGDALLKLGSLLDRAERVARASNEILHGVWARPHDGRGPMIRSQDRKWSPIPTAEDLRKLTHEIAAVTDELEDARLTGFIHLALAKRDLGVDFSRA